MSLSIQQVEHLAKLAKIELSREEKEKYAHELSAILDYVKRLEAVPKKSLIKLEKNQKNIMSTNNEEASRLRQDAVIGASTADIEALLKEVPEKQDRLIKVKAVFE